LVARGGYPSGPTLYGWPAVTVNKVPKRRKAAPTRGRGGVISGWAFNRSSAVTYSAVARVSRSVSTFSSSQREETVLAAPILRDPRPYPKHPRRPTPLGLTHLGLVITGHGVGPSPLPGSVTDEARATRTNTLDRYRGYTMGLPTRLPQTVHLIVS